MVNILSLLNLYAVLPGCCIGCNQATGRALDICNRCEHSLTLNTRYCRICALPLPLSAAACGDCLQRPPGFTRSISLTAYQGLTRRLIANLKYHQHHPTARVMATLLAGFISQQYQGDSLPELLIPVPLHWRRLHYRGYNQAQLLAGQLGRQLKLPVDCRSVTRQRPTAVQQTLDRQQRRHNLRQAFTAARPLSARHVALVDDVVTTTETMRALSQVLHQAGVARVDSWSIARTPAPGVGLGTAIVAANNH